MSITLHKGDLPADTTFAGNLAVDTETLGLDPRRDPLCLIQLSGGDGNAEIVQLDRHTYEAPNLKRLLSDPAIVKIFHFARFDLTMIEHYLGITAAPAYCTKIASRLVRTYTDRHGLKDICKELLNVDLSKQQQSSDWGAENLSDAQLAYAASDVLHLHRLKERLDAMLIREGRMELAQKCFEFLPVRARLDLQGWANEDIFAH